VQTHVSPKILTPRCAKALQNHQYIHISTSNKKADLVKISIQQGVSFAASLSMPALLHRKPTSARTTCDSCCALGQDTRTLLFYSTINTHMPNHLKLSTLNTHWQLTQLL